MYLKHLQLHHFKNHVESIFSFDDKVICFVGNNGVGKTNILDAIHYLSKTKSYFNHIDSQNIRFNSKYFNLKGVFHKDNTDIEIQCNVIEGNGKIIKNNQKKYKRFSEHIGKFPIVIISPTDTDLIIEGSDVRRKYIDSCISQYNSSYLQLLIKYNRSLKQRNTLLRQFKEQNYFDNTTLEIYNEQLINYGNIIHQERCNFIQELSPILIKYYSEISDNKEDISLKLESQLFDKNFQALLEESLFKDRKSNYTQCGIHKDDIIFLMNDYPIKKIGSQGQQKSFLISLKLAQFEFMKNKIGIKPILLLDDIFDKLDNKRVEKLIQMVNKQLFGQVFITDTQKERIQNIFNSSNIIHSIFTIENGSVCL